MPARQDSASFADIARRAGERNSANQRRFRLGSERGRDGDGQGDFQPVQPRRRRPVNHGISWVEIDEAGRYGKG